VHRVELFFMKPGADSNEDQPANPSWIPGRVKQGNQAPVRVAEQIDAFSPKVVLQTTEVVNVIVQRVGVR
jgi:hypothetical protein